MLLNPKDIESEDIGEKFISDLLISGETILIPCVLIFTSFSDNELPVSSAIKAE